MAFDTKRVYEAPAERDGLRVLVDRLWPRGLSRERAALDEWMPEAAPSTELRRWFHQNPGRWSRFRQRYLAELDREPAAPAAEVLRKLGRRRRVTLLYAARDSQRNHARILKDFLDSR